MFNDRRANAKFFFNVMAAILNIHEHELRAKQKLEYSHTDVYIYIILYASAQKYVCS